MTNNRYLPEGKLIGTKENRELMDSLAAFLIEKETITGKEFMKIFREVKGIPDPDAPTAEAAEIITETTTQDMP